MENDKKSQRGVFDLSKKMPAGKKPATNQKVVLVGVLTVVVLACMLGIGSILNGLWSRSGTAKICRQRANTVQFTYVEYDTESDKIKVRLEGSATEPETPILVDGKVVDMAHNDMLHSCADAGVEAYNVYTFIELEDCSVQKVGFRVGEEDIETEVNIVSPCLAKAKHSELMLDYQACEANHGQWDKHELKCIENKPAVAASSTSSSSTSSSTTTSAASTTSSTVVSTPKPAKAQAYGSDPSNPDTYTGAGASLEDKRLRAHILCKKYAEDYFYPAKVSFSSITGVVTDEELYYGWRYDVIMEVKSAAGGKQSYVMHCIAGSFNQDYSSGKVTKFEALRR